MFYAVYLDHINKHNNKISPVKLPQKKNKWVFVDLARMKFVPMTMYTQTRDKINKLQYFIIWLHYSAGLSFQRSIYHSCPGIGLLISWVTFRLFERIDYINCRICNRYHMEIFVIGVIFSVIFSRVEKNGKELPILMHASLECMHVVW